VAPAGSSVRKPADVLAELKRGRFEPVYILFGADAAAANELIAALKQAAVQPGLEPFDFESVHADDLPVSILLQHARQPAVGSARRLMVVRNIHTLEREPLKELCTGLGKLSDACCVALTCDFDAKLLRVLKEAGLGRFVVDVRQPEGSDLSALMRRRAKDLGISLEPAAMQMLLDIAGDDTSVLANELEKLAVALEPGVTASADDVKVLAGHSREFELSEYMRRFLAKDVKGAISVLVRLRAWGEEPVKIVAFLAGALLSLLAGRRSDQSEKWSKAQIRMCLLQLYEVNRDIVTGHPEPFFLVEAFTVCAPCPKNSRYCSLYAGPVQPAFCVWRTRNRAARRAAVNE
jgi:DNA polymerase-3 subunit delta